MRYATSESSNNRMLPAEQVLEYAASSADPSTIDNSVSVKPYKIVSLADETHNHLIDSFTKGKLLDEEDKNLLEKFYRETKESDPFQGVWQDLGEQQNQMEAALLDNENELQFVNRLQDFQRTGSEDTDSKWPLSKKNNTQPDAYVHPDWTLDQNPKLSQQINDPNNNNEQLTPIRNFVHQAKYSPTYKLLTSYDPTSEFREQSVARGTLMGSETVDSAAKKSKILGATLYGNDQNSKPTVRSKSALDAIKMHDDLLRSPPRDGKVRVRMYYHRAIHDDNRLYGNGPWKYWGHGWGLEFGFDPKKSKGKQDFYQKGYTIERAFGRDFCKDKRNCREPDPNFNQDPQGAGIYSKQYFSSPKRWKYTKRT